MAERLLRWLADRVYRNPRLFFYPHFLLLAVAVYYTVSHLGFTTDRSVLVGADKEYHRYFQDYKQEFAVQDDLVVAVESEEPEKNRQFVERLGARLDAEPKLFTDVLYKHDIRMLGSKALLFFPEDKLEAFRTALQDYQPLMRNFVQATNLNSLFRLINQQFRTARREANAENESLAKAIPALERIVNQATDSLNRPGMPPSPGITALFDPGGEAEASEYLTFATNHIYLVNSRARDQSVSELAVLRLRELVRATQAEVPGLNVGITGESVLEYDEMVQSQHDTTVATIVSLIIVMLIFIYGYRELGRPLKATVCLIVGLGYTMGFATLTIGSLNILTITFLPMLVGLAIDFGVHLVTRYEEEMRKGRSQRQALQRAMVNTGLGIFTGCFTTAGAFLAMGLTDFQGIREMGIISGGGLLICMVPMMTMLPAWLRQDRPMRQAGPAENRVDHRARIERLWLDRPLWVTGAAALLCVLAVSQFHRVYFDYNLLNMQSQNLEAVVFSRKLIAAESKSVLFAAIVTDNLAESVALEKKLTNLTTVASVESISSYLSEDQTGKLALVGQIKQAVEPLRFPAPDLEPVNLRSLRDTLTVVKGYLWYAEAEVRKGQEQVILQQLESLRRAIGRFLDQLASIKPELAETRLARFQQAFFTDLTETFRTLKEQDDRAPLRAQDLPAAFRNRFIGQTGRHLLMVYPKEDVWERGPQERFVKELRTLVPKATGTPVQLLEYTTLLKESYEDAARYALAAIVVLVFLHFITLGSFLSAVVSVLLALLPVAIGATWMVGWMGWFQIPFNPANIMTLPLVIGIGVTNGIHILNRYAEEHSPSILARSTGKAVLVSGLTTITGFGSLLLSKHQGMSSLGLVMAVGTATCMCAALTCLPALLTLLYRRRGK